MSCAHGDELYAYALRSVPESERLATQAHVAICPECRRESEALRRTIETFVSWPAEVLRPSTSLWGRLSRRIAEETGSEPNLAEPARHGSPEWREVAPGISCAVLAHDADGQIVSMLVRLAPGVEYPPHTHAGTEELHLLDGELWIDGRKLRAGDYNRADAGTSDARVWSETGCTCVLITSTRDSLG